MQMAIPPKVPPGAPGAQQRPSGARRRLLQTGLAVGPVLMTIASRPVLGSTACTTTSAWMSMTGSTAAKAEVCSGLSPEAWKGNATQWPSPYVGAVLGAPVVMDAGAVQAPVQGGMSGPTLGDPIKMPGVDGSGGTKALLATSTGTGISSVSPPGGSGEFAQPTRYHCPTTGFAGKVFGTRTMLEVLDVSQGGLDGVGRYMVAALLNARSGRTPVLDETAVRTMWNDLVNQGYYEPTAGIKWTGAEIIAYLQSTMG
jgi:hypothetical protein